MTETGTKVIALNYTLYRDNAEGELIESTEGKQPLAFLSGVGQMIPEFENNVVNLNAGDTFSFGIKADSAYGQRNEVPGQGIVDLPKDMFMQEGKMAEEVVLGNILPLQDQEGNMHPAVVLSIDEETIKMDVNHPLAGQDLHFTGTIVEVREATQEELDHGHVHGPNGVEH
ncbi:MAG: FKBP-type peptidyl-prolyl cis-trans isomerase [Flavobacteriales bacterium]